MNILIVEDEKSLAKEMQTFLKKEGYICDTATTGKEASEKIFVNPYDFLLLDLGLPDYDGLDLLKEAKEANSEASIIILTARGSTDDKVKGLDLGADDYLAKPFSLLELSSRMQAIIRRKHGLKKSNTNVHGFEVDINNRSISFKTTVISLTKKEFDILQYLLINKNRVITRMQLTEHIWDNALEVDYDSNYVDVHIKNLRKKLGQHADVDWLETVRGIGYRLNLL
ncbi:MAG TPA: response regulator transcription factor [Bacteroidia bacterium]|jgi:DNA-binding response OmpR family regulator|nr:response regulator transcription factor [Bacteroidia bacterium]